MKKITHISGAHVLLCMTLSVMLFSFTRASYFGGHSFQLYLDSKLVLEQYVNFKADSPKIIVDPAEKNNQLIVKYNECGQPATSRKITLKDINNEVLKVWSFEGSSVGYQESMACPVKDILIQKHRGTTLKLYYSSREFPEGRQLAYLVIATKTAAASK